MRLLHMRSADSDKWRSAYAYEPGGRPSIISMDREIEVDRVDRAKVALPAKRIRPTSDGMVRSIVYIAVPFAYHYSLVCPAKVVKL